MAEAEAPAAVGAVAFTVAVGAEDIFQAARAVVDNLGGPPWAAAQLRDLVADPAGLPAVHQACPRSITAPFSAVVGRPQGPPQARISAQAPPRETLEQARRAAIPLQAMASGTPLQEREAQRA